MAKKPERKQPERGDLRDDSAVALWASLLSLGHLRENAVNFRQLASNRKCAADAWSGHLQRLSVSDPERAQQLRAARPWLRDRPDAIEMLRLVLDNADSWLGRCSKAIREGGVRRLCEAVGSREPEIEIASRVEEAQALVWVLGLSLVDAVLFDGYAAELAAFGEWCGEMERKLRALLRLDGVNINRVPPGWDSSLPAIGAGLWVSIGPVSEAMPPADPSKPETSVGAGPTAKQLREATSEPGARAVSATVFGELVRTCPGVRKTEDGEKNRHFNPDEVRALIDHAADTGKQDSGRMARCWERWASPRKAPVPTESPRSTRK